ncbi:hypothetical protein Nepgr_023751 [Nepenthes gracilis]|uniref:TCP domain-containing protein n=1 Tax=Nepenthes gracilis TaxID=150966 RepID=A0AAD3T2P6_NEPGR|nr:hypothetical protein Nepgr_023751 [Nepenthes gracilis]
MMSLREKEIHGKLEIDPSNGKFPKAAASTNSSSRQWPGFKNPRIVRASRTFGGKDRHSKVCTIRGLRDRRIRLSVPTAIQLYDLQDRLKLSQPSKVIDWLLDITKLDIDKLPPLQIPPGSFPHFHQPALASNGPHHPSLTPFLDSNMTIMKDGPGNGDVEKEFEGEIKWRKASEEKEDEEEEYSQGGVGGSNSGQVSAQNFFPINSNNNTFLSSLLASNPMAYNYFHWEPSNLASSQFGSLGFPLQADPDAHNSSNNNNISIPIISSSSLPIPSESQLFLCQPMAATSLLPPYVNSVVETDYRQVNRVHQPSNSLSSAFHCSSLNRKSFPFSANPELHDSHKSDGAQHNKDDNGS